MAKMRRYRCLFIIPIGGTELFIRTVAAAWRSLRDTNLIGRTRTYCTYIDKQEYRTDVMNRGRTANWFSISLAREM